VAGLVQQVSWLHPIGRYGDWFAAHKELQRFLSPRENLVRAGVRGFQSPACCVLAEEDVRAVTEVLVHERGTGLRRAHVPAKLGDEVLWFR
jgi:hypothetical protein